MSPLPTTREGSSRTANQLVEWANVPASLAALTVSGASRHGFTLAVVRGERRMSEIVQCRRWIAHRARIKGFSFPQIGRALNRDHTSVMNLVGVGG